MTVTSLGGLTVGASAGSEGEGANALSTSADGALAVSSGAYYVFAGGRAFEIPNPTRLAAVRKADKAHALTGDVTVVQTSADIASGVLISASGAVFVGYEGDLYPFKSVLQLHSDGYSGTAAVPVPGTGGLPVVVGYKGA